MTKRFLICRSWNSESVFNTLYIEIKHKCLKKFSSGKNKRYKKCPFISFANLKLITVLLLICDSQMSTNLVSLKLRVGFSIFDPVSFLVKFIFLFDKIHGLFEFIIPQLKSHTQFYSWASILNYNKKF